MTTKMASPGKGSKSQNRHVDPDHIIQSTTSKYVCGNVSNDGLFSCSTKLTWATLQILQWSQYRVSQKKGTLDFDHFL